MKNVRSFRRHYGITSPQEVSYLQVRYDFRITPYIYYSFSNFILFLTNSLIWKESKHVCILHVWDYTEIVPQVQVIDVPVLVQSVQKAQCPLLCEVTSSI